MDAIRNTTDRKERQKLMKEHMQSMRAGMNMMQMMMEQIMQHEQAL